MTPEQVEQIRRIIAQALRDRSNFPWLTWILTATFLGMLALIVAYLLETGRRRAMYEAAERMTRAVEGVKSEYAAQLEYQRGVNQLRLAAMDKRLEAHQQAYGLWRKVIATAFIDAERPAALRECDEWWNKNCLYLSKESREAFQRSYSAAFHHADNARARGRNPELTKMVADNWEIIQAAGEVLVKATELPPIPLVDSKIPQNGS